MRVPQSFVNTEEPHKHLTEWFLKTVCKALLSTDRLRATATTAVPTPGAGFPLTCASIVPCAGAGGPLWPTQAEKRAKCQWIINAFYAARLRCTFRAEMRSMRFVIYLWNTHFSGKDIQLGLLDDAFTKIRLWYTLGEVQEGESTTHYLWYTIYHLMKWDWSQRGVFLSYYFDDSLLSDKESWTPLSVFS